MTTRETPVSRAHAREALLTLCSWIFDQQWPADAGSNRGASADPDRIKAAVHVKGNKPVYLAALRRLAEQTVQATASPDDVYNTDSTQLAAAIQRTTGGVQSAMGKVAYELGDGQDRWDLLPFDSGEAYGEVWPLSMRRADAELVLQELRAADGPTA